MTTPKTHLIRWLQFLGKVQFKTVQLLGGGLTPGRVSFAPRWTAYEISWSQRILQPQSTSRA
jgi:hypothetical protein